MKARIPPQKKLNRQTLGAVDDYMRQKTHSELTRFLKIVVVVLNRYFGFGTKRLNRFSQLLVPIHPIYYKTSIDLGKNSEGEERFIRLSYITSRDLLNKGTALFLKINYPNEYCKLADVYPEIRRWT